MPPKLVPAHVAEKVRCQLASGLLFPLFFLFLSTIDHLRFLLETVNITDNTYSFTDNLLQIRATEHANVTDRDAS